MDIQISKEEPEAKKEKQGSEYFWAQVRKLFAYVVVGALLALLAKALDYAMPTDDEAKSFVHVVLSIIDPRPAIAIASAALLGIALYLIPAFNKYARYFSEFARDARDASLSYLFLSIGALFAFSATVYAVQVAIFDIIAAFGAIIGVYSLIHVSKDGQKTRWSAVGALLFLGIAAVCIAFAFVPAAEMKIDHKAEASIKNSSIS